ncbi:MAG TPA: hypothetical protein VMV02_03530 [Acidimicrobiales bacterium]|nr:hypothetical protein [Acidimicrobiales bacterium]
MAGEHEVEGGPVEPQRAAGEAATPAEPDGVETLAAALRADAADLEVYERVLFASLAQSLPDGVVEVERVRSMADRVAGRPGRPTAIRVRLADETLEIVAGRGSPSARIARDVRGVTISRREVTITEWSLRLAQLLEQVARDSAATRDALERLLGTA